jgi:alcohol dehydrogenase
MMAKRWELHAFGTQGLRLATAPQPDPGPTEIVVAVKSTSLNHRDLMMVRNGMGMPIALPFVPGSDMSGDVVATGDRVHRFRTGDSVIGTFAAGWLDGARPPKTTHLGGPGPGVLGTHVTLDQDWAVPRPPALSHGEASTLPCAGLTAWTALIEAGGVRAGQTVLVHGTGGVALFGLQWAVMHGASVVVVTSDPDKTERVHALGASHVALRNQGDWVAEVRSWTAGRGVDHVLETVGGDNLARSLEALAPDGTIAVVGSLAGPAMSLSFMPLVSRRATVRGISVGHRRSLEEAAAAAQANRLVPVIGARYGLADLPEALAALERGSFGKIVVDVDA